VFGVSYEPVTKACFVKLFLLNVSGTLVFVNNVNTRAAKLLPAPWAAQARSFAVYPSPNARLRDTIFKAEVFMSGESTRQIGARLLKYNPQSGRRAPPGGRSLKVFDFLFDAFYFIFQCNWTVARNEKQNIGPTFGISHYPIFGVVCSTGIRRIAQ